MNGWLADKVDYRLSDPHLLGRKAFTPFVIRQEWHGAPLRAAAMTIIEGMKADDKRGFEFVAVAPEKRSGLTMTRSLARKSIKLVPPNAAEY